MSREDRLRRGYELVAKALLSEAIPMGAAAGTWAGELSSSPLSTATAVTAFVLVMKQQPERAAELEPLIRAGLSWLVAHQNADGGWGDTVLSHSNISTTALAYASFHLAANSPASQLTAWDASASNAAARAKSYFDQHGGFDAIRKRYGKDHTFSVPILTHCALAGLIPWRDITPLPFELGCLPHWFYRWIRLPVVSYALPALIAIGQVRHHLAPSWNPLLRWIRQASVAPTLRKLESIQPQSGGFLEATPLTSFVTMSLAAMGQSDHAVARAGVRFLIESVRPDGSWPIDTNLATWVTTLSVNALASDSLPVAQGEAITAWLLGQQLRIVHRYTNAAPGGWAWTDLSGGVPDADDTPGAILALLKLAPHDPNVLSAVEAAITWLLDLQNSDGGWPTFCRGWGALPFDRSTPDLTAHVLRAFRAWLSVIERDGSEMLDEHEHLAACDKSMASATLSPTRSVSEGDVRQGELRGGGSVKKGVERLRPRSRCGLVLSLHQSALQRRVERAVSTGFAFLARTQRADGTWLPLWFGNQFATEDENPVYGVSKGLMAYRDWDRFEDEQAQRAVAWLVSAQNSDGGWGGAANTPSSVEETALAIEALLPIKTAEISCSRGLEWLFVRVESEKFRAPAPIGLYFAKLWYFERLYPIIFATSALARAIDTTRES